MMVPRRSRHPPAHLSALALLLVLLSLPGSSSSLSVSRNYVASPTTTTSTTRGNVVVRIAIVPVDLPAIRDCRRSAYAGKSVNLPAARSFCEADQITREGYVCVIATEAGSSGGRVLGTADLNTKTGVVNNVYVRDEARKRGIARSMMKVLEEYFGGGMKDGNDEIGRGGGSGSGRRRKLALAVMSKNTPAVNLYKGLGYKAPGIYGGLDAISTMSPLNFLIEMEKEI